MGQRVSASAPLPDGVPDRENGSSFDPLLGFADGREERVMKVTKEEMESAKVPLEDRGFCAHHYIIYNTCRRKVWPLAYQCGHEKHQFLQCKYEDYIIRMKEFEREKRLLARAKRIAAKSAAEEL
ncbi:UNVERIFIED_CONTAM: hypothetical protein GTU68_024014 [Idotea baltica]|nr:hypothetical protein [Idotea baltica]